MNPTLDALAAILQLEPAQRRSAAQQLQQNQDAQEVFEVLQSYAAADEPDPNDPAVALLDAVETRIGAIIPGKGKLKAFQLMVDLGLWSEHQNLMFLRFGVPVDFSTEVLQAAEECAQKGFRPGPDREDFTSWWTVTIDDADTRDIDDGFSVRPSIDGGWELAIHIADPSAFVKPGDILDLDARARSTTIYAPERVVPMFPPVLSEGLMSLVAGQTRPALTTHIELNEELEITRWRVVPSVVKVNRRMTYDEADALLEADSHEHAAEILATLKWLADERLIERAGRGAVQIDLPEARVKVAFEEQHPQVKLRILKDTPARSMVAELMVWCNELAAQYLRDHQVPAMFRTQDAPDQALDARDVLAIPEGPARQFAILRRMKKGELTSFPNPHYGLGVTCYVQASSPIRRYSDLVIHRQIKAHAAGEPIPYDAQSVFAVMADVERATYEAQQIERETRRYWLIFLLAQLPPQTPVQGTVLEVRDDGKVFVLIEDYALRTVVKPKRSIAPGGQITLEVERADPRKDVLMFRATA